MFHFLLEFTEIRVALLAEGVDRNPMEIKSFTKSPRSPSSRRAWIEIRRSSFPVSRMSVALLAEGVDRNRLMSVKTKLQARVALLAEGVDRNFLPSRT